MKKRCILYYLFILIAGIIQAQQPDLNYFLDQARTNSPLIQKNKDANKVLILDLKQTEALLKSPEINLESNILFAPIISHDNNTNRFELTSPGATNYSGYDQANTDGGQFQAFISVRQPLLNGSSLKTYSARSDISRRKNENATTLTIHELEQLVGYQYILCLKSKVQIKNSESVIKLLNDQLQLMQKLVEHAIYKQTDLMLLQIEYQNLELQNKTLDDEFKSNLYDLKLLCGINDPNIKDIQPVELQMKAETNGYSSFLNSFKLDSLNIVSEQSITQLKYKPQLSLFANAGLNAVYVPSFNRLGFSAGLTFSWNIYDGGQRRFELEKSKVNLHTLQFEKDNFITQQEINKNKILNQMKSLKERILIIENQLIQYDKLYDAYQKELSQGQISIMDFKNLLKDITAKNQEKTVLEMEKQVLINSSNYWNY
ncbi:MAG: TolC family protein [Paludibacter sp.]|nr:TolC family protein [Paludibacter sp.]